MRCRPVADTWRSLSGDFGGGGAGKRIPTAKVMRSYRAMRKNLLLVLTVFLIACICGSCGGGENGEAGSPQESPQEPGRNLPVNGHPGCPSADDLSRWYRISHSGGGPPIRYPESLKPVPGIAGSQNLYPVYLHPEHIPENYPEWENLIKRNISILNEALPDSFQLHFVEDDGFGVDVSAIEHGIFVAFEKPKLWPRRRVSYKDGAPHIPYGGALSLPGNYELFKHMKSGAEIFIRSDLEEKEAPRLIEEYFEEDMTARMMKALEMELLTSSVFIHEVIHGLRFGHVLPLREGGYYYPFHSVMNKNKLGRVCQGELKLIVPVTEIEDCTLDGEACQDVLFVPVTEIENCTLDGEACQEDLDNYEYYCDGDRIDTFGVTPDDILFPVDFWGLRFVYSNERKHYSVEEIEEWLEGNCEER